ncbi:MAG: aspartate--tRNA ligase, partial [Clostridia bacterium]|nr:aspartate--tRNA ligase [Clostridia bacterium]
MEFLGNIRRTKMCGEFRTSDLNKQVVAMGFVAKERNLGTLIFIDLRDRSGIVQISFEQKAEDNGLFEKASRIRNEYVIAVTGTVRSRGEKNINKNILTGEIEIIASELIILNVAEALPIVLSDLANESETLRLKYRYLDLRRPSLQEKLIIRSRVTKIVRDYMDYNSFLEIETPFLGRSTPEGARDYLVPSRVHKGEFYALPQSPQQYKQLLMISGFDRYYQIARCFRDEDLRANRQPEFSQIDMEMSFADAEDLMVICEGLIGKVFKDIIGYTIPEKLPR